jgi:tricorn protease
VWAIDGVPLNGAMSPSQALVNKANVYVSLVVSADVSGPKRTLWVKPLAHITPARYHDWVEKNRAYVAEKTQGRVGYIHIPDMVEAGFAAFFRSYMQEFDKEGLVVDVRFNNGGHISTLLLATLARKRLGFDQTRWDGQVPYLTESPRGPMVALCNELTASDGDMFAHSFQKMGLGPLIGTRTWGGVIGIFPRHPLLDGSMTSQPEYAIWFHDIGWRLENTGAVPDIVVDNTPLDARQGRDAQLDRGIQEVLQRVC